MHIRSSYQRLLSVLFLNNLLDIKLFINEHIMYITYIMSYPTYRELTCINKLKSKNINLQSIKYFIYSKKIYLHN